MKINSALIQNDKVLIIFEYLLAKLQFRDYSVLLRTVQATEKIFGNRLNQQKLSFSSVRFCDAGRGYEKSFTRADKASSFANKAAKIGIDALKI